MNVFLIILKKLRHRCKDYKKIIATLTLDVENVKHDYDLVIDSKNELEIGRAHV